MTESLLIILCCLLSFFSGALPFSFWLVRVIKDQDLRKLGSGNVGATNVFRSQGKTMGFTALFLDILKGLFPVVLIPMVFEPTILNPFLFKAFLGVAAIFGHTWTPFLGWKGGKGVATSVGVFMGLLPIPCLIALGVFLVVFAITQIISLSSLSAAVAFPITVLIIENKQPYFLIAFSLTVFIAGFIFYTHRSNIARLLKGEEKKLRKNKE